MLQLSAIERLATFDPTGRYRYSLGRRWSTASTLAIIMLNPSQADSNLDDPTICQPQPNLTGQPRQPRSLFLQPLIV